MLRLVAVVLAVALATTPGFTQEASPSFKDPACPTLAEVEAYLTGNGDTFVILDTKSLIGVTVKGGGTIIVTTNFHKKIVAIGAVVDGCVTPPQNIGEVSPTTGI